MGISFTSIYQQERPIFSFEFFPPKSEEKLPSVFERLHRFEELKPDFMTVTYGAGGGTRSLTRKMTEFIANELAIPAVAHLTCVGHTQDELASILDDLQSRKVKHVLALRGDPPKDEKFVAPENGFACARDLAKFIQSRGDFNIAVAGYPEVHPDAESADLDVAYLKEKEDAGAEVVFTQLFFEAKHYFDFVKRAKAAGVTIPIVPGIMPVSDIKQVVRITKLCGATFPIAMKASLEDCGDDKQRAKDYGVEQATALCKELLAGGAPGIHFYTLNKSQQVERVLSALR